MLSEIVVPVLESLGYEYKPRDAIPGRLFFAKESSPQYRTHHLSLAELDSGFWKSHIAFRDTIRAHDDMAAEYIELKIQLAETYARTQQLDRDGKTEFVSRVLEMAAKEQRQSG